LLEWGGDGAWLVDAGDGAGSRLVGPAALAALFPCEVIVAAPDPPATVAAAGAARLSAVAVYLRLVAQLLGLSTPIAMMLVVDKVVTQGAQNTLAALVAGVALLTVFQYLFLVGHTLHAVRESEALALPARRALLDALF